MRSWPVYGAVLDALDLVHEEGVPRAAVGAASADVIRHWERTWGHADDGVMRLRARWPRVAPVDPTLVALVVVARAIVALARDAGLAVAIAGGEQPPLAALEGALTAALVYARAAHHERLHAALTGSAA